MISIFIYIGIIILASVFSFSNNNLTESNIILLYCEDTEENVKTNEVQKNLKKDTINYDLQSNYMSNISSDEALNMLEDIYSDTQK